MIILIVTLYNFIINKIRIFDEAKQHYYKRSWNSSSNGISRQKHNLVENQNGSLRSNFHHQWT